MENQTGVEEELEDTLKLLKLKEKTQDVIVLIKTKVTSIIKCLQTGIVSFYLVYSLLTITNDSLLNNIQSYMKMI